MKLSINILKLFALFLVIGSFTVNTFAHDHISETFDYLNPIFYLKIVISIIVIATITIIIGKEKVMKGHEKLFFLIFVIPTLIITFYMIGLTTYENIESETKGPIHWHSRYEISACGEDLELINPTGLNNKIGTPLFHEHNDNQVHIEGTVMNVDSITMGKFFETIGGKLENGELKFITEEIGLVEFKDGDKCPSGKPATLKVYINGKITDDYYNYLGYPDSYVPPGDCIIIKFDESTDETTDQLCDEWEINGWDYKNYISKRPEVKAYGRTWEGYK